MGHSLLFGRFVLFQDLEPFTYRLAVGEWVILLMGLALWFADKAPSP